MDGIISNESSLLKVRQKDGETDRKQRAQRSPGEGGRTDYWMNFHFTSQLCKINMQEMTTLTAPYFHSIPLVSTHSQLTLQTSSGNRFKLVPESVGFGFFLIKLYSAG